MVQMLILMCLDGVMATMAALMQLSQIKFKSLSQTDFQALVSEEKPIFFNLRGGGLRERGRLSWGVGRATLLKMV